ncbi:uncharacterized protein METZ01_LOCUS230733, partial [marine metagenome]
VPESETFKAQNTIISGFSEHTRAIFLGNQRFPLNKSPEGFKSTWSLVLWRSVTGPQKDKS